MSLRVFHIIFIVVSILLSLFVAGWGIWFFATTGAVSGLLLSAVFAALGVALVLYGNRTFEKLKDLAS